MSKKIDYKAEHKHQEFIRAGYIKDRYPRVKILILELNYKDTNGLAQPFHKSYSLTPENSAFFKYNCPYRECIEGGHDLTQPISDMLKNNKVECSGKISCQGWQDRERIGKHRCLCELTYKVTVTY